MAAVDWEARIANETNPVKKQIMMRMYKHKTEQARVAPSKYDPSLAQGGNPYSVPEVRLFVAKSEAKDISKGDKKFSVTEFECYRMGLPFVEVTPIKGKIDVPLDQSVIQFTLPHASEWLNGKTATISCTGKISVRMMSRGAVAPGWHKFLNFSVTQKPGGNGGTLFTNVTCKETRPWPEGPAFYMLHRLACRLWTNERYMPRPIDPAHYPSQDMISAYEQQIKAEKGSAAASSSSSSSAEPPAEGEDNTSGDFKIYAEAFGKAVMHHLSNLGIDWQLHPELRQQVPQSRDPYIIPLNMSEDDQLMACGLATKTQTVHSDVFFNDDLRVCQNGGEVKPFVPSAKNPFTMHVHAGATASVSFVDLETDETVGTLVLAPKMCGQAFFQYLGIVNPYMAASVLPSILSKIPMTIIASPNMQATRDKDQSDEKRTLILDVFNPPIIDYLAMIRNTCVQVTPAFAVQRINEYVKACDPNAKVVEGKAKAATLLHPDEKKIFEVIFSTNAVARVTNNMVFNCMEGKITISAKKSAATHRLYAMSPLIPGPEDLAEYRAVAAAFHAAAPGSEEAKALHGQLSGFATRHSDYLQKQVGRIKPFAEDDHIVIWAISRELDHVSGNTEFEDPAFTLEAVNARSAQLAKLKAASDESAPASSAPVEAASVAIEPPAAAPPVAVADDPVREPATVGLCGEVPEMDDMDMGVVEERPKGRKRVAPTSPGKKNAVTKKERAR